jgi:hypothetical protein
LDALYYFLGIKFLPTTRKRNWPVWLIQVKFSEVSWKVLMAYKTRLKGMGIKKEH